MDFQQKRIFVAGHRGMVGKALVRRLKNERTGAILTKTRSELDLTSQSATESFFEREKPDVVIFAAAKVGGIHANSTYPAEFLYDNLAMASNTINSAYHHGVERLLFLGSTCIYPKMAPQPLEESCLLTSPLEPTNEAYAIAKIAGLKMCEFYRQQYGAMFHSAMPTNLYGPGDNYHPDNSHVLPGLLKRIHDAKIEGKPTVKIWGTGSPRREFLYVDCLADACIHLLQLDEPPNLVNVGTGVDCTIKELAELIAETVDYQGTFEFDTSKPDGTPIKRTDTTLLNATGWHSQIDLKTGLKMTLDSYLKESQSESLRSV